LSVDRCESALDAADGGLRPDPGYDRILSGTIIAGSKPSLLADGFPKQLHHLDAIDVSQSFDPRTYLSR
jgi:hypothetical protein